MVKGKSIKNMGGQRRGATSVTNSTIGMNRKGLQVPLSNDSILELNTIAGDGKLAIDSESIGDKLYLFDLLMVKGKSIKNMGALKRIKKAEKLFAGCKSIVVLESAETTKTKRELFEKIRKAHGEGVVFKLKDSISKEGRPASGGDWLKYKFVETASCRVSGYHKQGKRSVSLEIMDETGKWVDVGNTSIYTNFTIPSIGAIVDVDYLYAYKGGSLYQPVYKGERTDLDEIACNMKQLKYKPDGQYDEEDEVLFGGVINENEIAF